MKQSALNPILIFLVMCFAGCGAMPDIVSTEKKDGEKYSADEVRRITVDQPFLISGDYFREREPDTRVSIDFSGMEEEKPATPAKTEAREIAKASPAVTEQKPAISKPALPLKVGFVFGEQTDAETAKRLNRALEKTAGSFPALVSGPAALLEDLEGAACPKTDNIDCVAKSLGVYPGIRMLVIVEALTVPGSLPGKALVKATVVDTGTGFHHPPFEIDGNIGTPSETEAFLDAALDNIIGFCLKKSEAIPWFCRAFSKENNQIYISAGSQSGLKPGDRLETIGPGKLVKSPGGMPAGWIPGDAKGVLKIDLLFGRDFAACSLVEGQPPLKEDMLVIAK